MLAVVLASGLLIRDTSDAHAYAARLHSARSSYDRCLFQNTKDMFHGSDSPDLEQAILASCQNEFDAYADAMGAGAPPNAQAAARASLTSMMPTIVHMAVQAEQACAADIRHRKEPGHVPITCDMPPDP